jgi:ABC-type lipoprotein export system ATPase subunit
LIKSIRIQDLKGIKKLEFEIPGTGVHFLAGSNGSGKTTLLACLRRLRHRNSFQLHFLSSLKSKRLDGFNGAEITYTLGDRSVTYAYAGERWVPRPRRSSNLVQEFGYPDVLYVGATASRITPRPEDFDTKKLRPASTVIIEAANKIFETSRFLDLRTINLTTGNKNQAFVLVERKANPARVLYFSEKNFSLGELCVLKLLRDLSSCHNGTLVLIDELELALHPRAQLGLIQHLETLAREKALTVIVSTHSVTLIKRAPRSKIVFLEKRETQTAVLKGCFSAYALGNISLSEERIPDVVVYVEDEAARIVAEALLKLCIMAKYSHSSEIFPTVRVLPIGDYKNVVRFLDKNKAMLPDYVRQWALLDKDVEVEIRPLVAAASNDPLRDMFLRNEGSVRYLPWTPEVGVISFLASKREEVLKKLKRKYLNQYIQISQESLKPTGMSGSDLRKESKSRLKSIVSSIQSDTTNITVDSINEYLYELFAESYFESNRETALQLFAPLIS